MSPAKKIVQLFPFMNDTFQNLLAGFGVLGRDKAVSQQAILRLLSMADLEALYRGDWLSRKIIDAPAFDMCRQWRQWQADAEDITKIEECEITLKLQQKLMEAMCMSRLYGGACLILGVDRGDFRSELDPKKVQKDELKFVHVVSKNVISTGPRVRDIMSPWFNQPSYFVRPNVPTPPPPGGVEPVAQYDLPNALPDMGSFYIHPSRVIQFVGAPYPDPEIAPDAWGDSVLQIVHDAINSTSMVNSSISSMIAEAKVDVIKMPGLAEVMSTQEGSSRLIERFARSNAAKSVVNTLMLDAKEEWERHTLALSGFDSVMMTYLTIAAGAADIPATRLLGKSPSGMDATGESDMRNYYDRLKSDQNMRLKPALGPLDEIIIRSLIGTREPGDFSYEWRPLWQMDDAQKADIEFKIAQAHAVDANSGLIDPVLLRTGRENYLSEHGVLYPGFDVARADYEEEFAAELEERSNAMREAEMNGLNNTGQPDDPAVEELTNGE
jgi:phage-related protein (TIGR01555 family)